VNHQDFLLAWRIKYPDPSSLLDNGASRFYPGKGTMYVQVRCPFCKKNGKGEDKSHHCNAHYEDGSEWFKCQRCGEGGSIQYLLGIQKQKPQTQNNSDNWSTFVSRPETRKTDPRLLARSKGLEGSRIKPGATVALCDLPRSHVAWQYLKSEGFTEDKILGLAEKHGIFYCQHGTQFTGNELNTTSHRLIFEIREEDQTYGWQARWLPKHWPPSPEDIAMSKEIEKYLFSPGLKKSYMLYNWDYAQRWDSWIVVEGIKKVWRTGEFSLSVFGISNSATPPIDASEGALNQYWSMRLLNGNRPIGILYDKDALSTAVSQVEKLKAMGVDAKVIPLPANGPKDLDSYPTPEIRQIIKNHMGRLPKIIPQ
jgi:hypothetical protein